MGTLITRIGKRDVQGVCDPNRSRLDLTPRVAGSFGGHIKREGFEIDTYGNCLRDALSMSFYWADIRLYTIFDVVDEIALRMVSDAVFAE